MTGLEHREDLHRSFIAGSGSATAVIGSMRLESLHLFALPTYDVVRRKIQGRHVQVTAYRKTLLTLSTRSRLPNGGFQGMRTSIPQLDQGQWPRILSKKALNFLSFPIPHTTMEVIRMAPARKTAAKKATPAKTTSAAEKATPASKPAPAKKKVWEYIKKNGLQDTIKRT